MILKPSADRERKLTSPFRKGELEGFFEAVFNYMKEGKGRVIAFS
jgi:hypothetical protein